MENNNKKRDKNTWLIVVSILLVCIAVVCLILFLTQGQTTVTGGYDGLEAQEHLVCESKTTTYPLFSYDNSTSKSMKITATFRDDDLNSISLTYKLNYDDAEEIKKSEATNHGALNTTSQDEGLGPDAYEATYSKLKDGLQLSLYATGSEIDSRALKYFMLDSLTSTSYSQEKVAQA
ncbi:hypothetical protein IJG04_00555, partial [Candidatus Saccharibacteria bacterium]|nr:hypothetical protein [Candidatus Saccharibacteria bacterium]